MRKTIAALTAVSAVLICVTVAPAVMDEAEVDPRDVKAIALAPIAEPLNGKNVALTLEVKPPRPKRLPRGISIVINGKQVNLVDDGTWPDARAGDGIYTAAAKTKDGQPLKEKIIQRLEQSGGQLEHHASALPSSCTFRRVDCPVGCKSLIFRTRCVICFELVECEIGF
jgi:hypothetical protein